MKSKERDKSILEYVQCMYNNVHTYKVSERERKRRLHSREEIEYRECLLIIFLCWFSYIYTLFNYINIILYYTKYILYHTYKYNNIYMGI